MTLALNKNPHPYPRLRRFAIDLAITTVFNVVIAVIVTYVMRVHDVFYVNLVISLCIGTLGVTLVDGGRLLIWGNAKPARLPFFILLFTAMPVAFRLGNALAAYLLDIPMEELDIARSRNATSVIIMTVLASFFCTWFFWTRAKLEELKAEAEAEKARNAAIEKQAMQAQLQMLQAQIEPHMLFNTLANLQGLIAVDPPRAQHMLDQLIQYLRATLLSSRSGQSTLAQEFALMDAYLGLMTVRMGSRLRYTLRLPDELRDVAVPPMLLQPLVENAIKHGLEPKVGAGCVEVMASRQDGILDLRVADDGLGLDATPGDSNGTHVGIANIRERLHALYGERASFALLPNTPDGVIAQLRLPS
ncbi:MAG: sensor histidine kinase [Noviherbaspirillum sp.]